MKELKVKDIYDLRILSQDDGWVKIFNKLKELGYINGEEVLLDFEDITVKEPYRREHFLEMLTIRNLYFKFYNLGKAYDLVRVQLLMDGSAEDRIINIQPEEVAKPTVVQKRVSVESNELRKYFKIEDGVMSIRVADKYSQCSNSLSAKYIENAAEDLLREHPEVKRFIVDLKGVVVSTAVINLLVDMEIHMERDMGIDVDFDIEGESTIEGYKLYRHNKLTESYDKPAKIRELKGVAVGTAGVLITYKKSRALDEFGRHGKGQVSSARIAIFEGLVRDIDSDGNKQTFAEFCAYRGNKFYTKEHWMLENDGEELEKLDQLYVRIPVGSLGLYDKFLGSDAHFARPIQEDLSENVKMREVAESGEVKTNEYTLPERMKAVFDDFGIDYNKEQLDEDIIETREKLYPEESK